MPMTLGNELFQHTAFFKQFGILDGLRQDAYLNGQLFKFPRTNPALALPRNDMTQGLHPCSWAAPVIYLSW